MTDKESNGLFNFDDNSDKEDDQSSIVNKQRISEDNNSEHNIHSIDPYDLINFQRIAIKRNTRKGKTQINTNTQKLRIEKFTEEITRYTEEMVFPQGSPDIKKKKRIVGDKERKKTIRFANKRITYQYPKEKESVKLLNDKETQYETEEEYEKKEDEEPQLFKLDLDKADI